MASKKIALHEKAKKQGFSARFVCLTGKKLEGGMHPIRLQLIQDRKVKRYSTGHGCKREQWDQRTARVKPDATGAGKINRALNAIEGRVCDIVDVLVVNKALSLENFAARYHEKKASGELLDFIEALAEVMLKGSDHLPDGLFFGKAYPKGKAGNAAVYRNLHRVLRRFTDGKPLPFSELTPAKLEAFDQHLRNAGCTEGGISVYMRTLRAVVRRAAKGGLMDAEAYPFETELKGGYSIKGLSSTRNPRPLQPDEMDRLKAFPFDERPDLAPAVRIFLFSYYASGMNFADIARLKHSDRIGERIVYKRQKTKRKGSRSELSFKITERIAEILAAFGDHHGEYLFPFLGPEHVTEKQKKDRIDRCLKRVNRQLKEVAEVLDIDTHLTTYVARHTFATTLSWNDVPVEVISQRLGHKDIATTQRYMARLPNKVLDEVDAIL